MPNIVILALNGEPNVEPGGLLVYTSAAYLCDDDEEPCKQVAIRIQFPIQSTPAQIEDAIVVGLIEAAATEGVVVTPRECVFPDIKRGKP